MNETHSKGIGITYDKIAEWWNGNAAFSDRGLKETKRAIEFCKERKTALDIGCGSGGRNIQLLLDSGFQVTGIDVSQKMLELAKQQYPQCTFLLEDIRHLDIKERFDLIIAWDSIWHIPSSEQRPVLKKLCGFLSSSGVLAYTFGDGDGDKKDLSFSDDTGQQIGGLNNDYFDYGTIGIYENIAEMRKNGMKIRYFNHFTGGPEFIVAEKDAASMGDVRFLESTSIPDTENVSHPPKKPSPPAHGVHRSRRCAEQHFLFYR